MGLALSFAAAFVVTFAVVTVAKLVARDLRAARARRAGPAVWPPPTRPPLG